MKPPSRREQKAAATRVGLLQAMLRRIDERPLSEIPVKELCAEVGVSNQTFFNYFETKQALVLFFLSLWSVDMAARIAALDQDDPLAAIEEFFVTTAELSEQNPGIMAEILAAQARFRFETPPPPPTDADLMLAFPDRPELLEAPRDLGLQALIPPLIARAVALGQLPPHTDVGLAFMGVATIFFGAAVLRRQAPQIPIPVAYRLQLQRLWTALRAAPAPADAPA